jgi:hypothetical protein
VGLGQFLDTKDQNADLEEFLKKVQEVRYIKGQINQLAEIELELIRDGGDLLDASGRNDLRLAKARLEYELAIKAAKKDKAKKEEAARAKEKADAAAAAAFRRERLREEKAELRRQQQVQEAERRNRQAKRGLEAAPVFGETQSSQVFKQVFLNVAGAGERLNKAKSDLSDAVREYNNAKAFGNSEDIKDAANQVRVASIDLDTAGINFRAALQEGSTKLLDNVKSAAIELRDSVRNLRDLRLGNLRFIPQEQRQQLIQAELKRALPEAQQRKVALRGLEDVFAFNKFVETELSARQQVADAQRNVADANATLNSAIVQSTGATGRLVEVMDRLVDKSWTVYVQAPGQNVATAINLQAQLGS